MEDPKQAGMFRAPSCVTALKLALLVCLGSVVGLASIRGPGKYSGVVIFDRWGGCYLYGGVYLMPVSEKVKDLLGKFANEAITVDALEVGPHPDPGDGLIEKLTVLGPAPDSSEREKPVPEPGEFTLTATADFSAGNQLMIQVRNNTRANLPIRLDELAPTILVRKQPRGCELGTQPAQCFIPSTGTSYAALTRCAVETLYGVSNHFEFPCEQEGQAFFGPPGYTPPTSVAPGQVVAFPVIFQLSPGEYDFLAGYGGGVLETRLLVSNQLDFDVDAAGKPHLSQ